MAQVFSLRDEVKVLEEKTRGVGGVLLLGLDSSYRVSHGRKNISRLDRLDF